MNNWNKPADNTRLQKTRDALIKNGINAEIVENKEEAKKRVLEMIPENVEVMNYTSVTLDTMGISKEIVESGKYKAVRNKLNNKLNVPKDRSKYLSQMRKLAAAPDWGVGSIHAITEEGELVFASFTGSQLPGYAFGAANMIWVAGAQKIVKNVEAGLKRIYEYVLPLESERAKKAYGSSGSAVNKILIIKRELNPKRAILFIVKESVGF